MSIEEPLYSSPGGDDRPVIATAAEHELREALKKVGSENLDELGIATVKYQLEKWAAAQKQADAVSYNLGTKFGVDFDKLKLEGRLGRNPEKDAEIIVGAVRGPGHKNLKEVWSWKKLPYAVRCAGLARKDEDEDDEGESRGKKKARVEGGDDLVIDLDECSNGEHRILQNEIYLRNLTRKAKVDSPGKDWTYGLVNGDDLSTVLPTNEPVKVRSDTVGLEIPRQPVNALPGFSFLDLKRRDTAFVQPNSAAVRERWETMTGGLFKGLDWTNVCVAGGLILGALLTPDIPKTRAKKVQPHTPEEWASSDIDVYIYGLGPEAANAKIAHIADVVKRNLPEDAPFLLVRNSQTVTLYSNYPTRRVQIVLKLVESPREVLLNFDLDICAVAFDGTDVWMLPRVFKYANKGFGFRILPSYLAALSTYANKEATAVHARGERLLPPPYNLQDMADAARQWTRECLDNYIKVKYENRPFHWPKGKYKQVESSKPVFTHAMLESRGQRTSEPLTRSCLTGFSLLMRHVALWEEEVKGKVVIKEDLWAAETYGEGLAIVAYDDTPAYTWDENFKLEDFKQAIDEFNKKESKNFGMHLYQSRKGAVQAARITYADNADALLDAEHDIRIPLFLGAKFKEYAERVIGEAIKDNGFQLAHPVLHQVETELEPQFDAYGMQPVLWQLDRVLNWQMVDRRIDEVREALWAYHRGLERLGQADETLGQMMQTNLSRRAIRTSVPDEMGSFVRWVGRKPHETRPFINAHFVYQEEGVRDSDYEERADDDEDEW
uniref:Uncharacterized protein n=1 Tax=Schizophyllum commune (strain H4-8 / FGSC 9210) TaxID=578458 RepID=D8Q175_SCHCM